MLRSGSISAEVLLSFVGMCNIKIIRLGLIKLSKSLLFSSTVLRHCFLITVDLMASTLVREKGNILILS